VVPKLRSDKPHFLTLPDASGRSKNANNPSNHLSTQPKQGQTADAFPFWSIGLPFNKGKGALSLPPIILTFFMPPCVHFVDIGLRQTLQNALGLVAWLVLMGDSGRPIARGPVPLGERHDGLA
jgi:hypothetical protein